MAVTVEKGEVRAIAVLVTNSIVTKGESKKVTAFIPVEQSLQRGDERVIQEEYSQERPK